MRESRFHLAVESELWHLCLSPCSGGGAGPCTISRWKKQDCHYSACVTSPSPWAQTGPLLFSMLTHLTPMINLLTGCWSYIMRAALEPLTSLDSEAHSWTSHMTLFPPHLLERRHHSLLVISSWEIPSPLEENRFICRCVTAHTRLREDALIFVFWVHMKYLGFWNLTKWFLWIIHNGVWYLWKLHKKIKRISCSCMTQIEIYRDAWTCAVPLAACELGYTDALDSTVSGQQAKAREMRREGLNACVGLDATGWLLWAAFLS
jgi:hypothetical protein